MVKPILTVLILWLALPLLCGVYGVLHDQITFSISNEYYTKFKYIQFQVYPEDFGSARKAVGIIGFRATWWLGIPMALVLSLFVLATRIRRNPLHFFSRAIGLIFLVVVLFFCIGYGYGTYHKNSDPDWFLPTGLNHKPAFVLVGYIHNFGYLGGALGLISSAIYLFAKAFRNKNVS